MQEKVYYHTSCREFFHSASQKGRPVQNKTGAQGFHRTRQQKFQRPVNLIFLRGMEKKQNYMDAKNVLIFNMSRRILIAVVRSLHSAAKLTNGNLQAISFACTGKYIASGGYYFRHVHPDVEINMNSLNVLKLKEYDRMCGEERQYCMKKKVRSLEKRHQLQSKKKTDKQENNKTGKQKEKTENGKFQ
jgi:hypothetical protein